MNRQLLGELQKKHKRGGFALVSEEKGQEIAFGKDIEFLYKKIDKKKIKDSSQVVMHIPPLNAVHVF
jgi:hypothetical protein